MNAIAQSEFGPRRSLLCLIADWLEAEAEIRSGNTERGHTLATEATNRARGFQELLRIRRLDRWRDLGPSGGRGCAQMALGAGNPVASGAGPG